MHPMAMHASSVFYTGVKEAEKAKTAQVAKVEEAPAGPEAVGKTWCPHPSLLRGMCRLNKPRALDWGIDLEAAKGWE